MISPVITAERSRLLGFCKHNQFPYLDSEGTGAIANRLKKTRPELYDSFVRKHSYTKSKQAKLFQVHITMEAPFKEPVTPIYPRLDDPFFGMTGDFIRGLGGGDYNKGNRIVLEKFVERWNFESSYPDSKWPMTSMEKGLEWMPTIDAGTGKVVRVMEDGTITDPPPRSEATKKWAKKWREERKLPATRPPKK